MKETRTYPLRLPRSLKDAVERLSREDGTSMNQFVTMAVAEKVRRWKRRGFSRIARRVPILRPSTRY